MIDLLLIRLRGLTAALTILAVICMTVSMWVYTKLQAPIGVAGSSVGATMFGGGGLLVWWGYGENPAWFSLIPAQGWKYWQWDFDWNFTAKSCWFQFPSWAVVMAPATASFAGFRLRRRRIRVGACLRCGYQLKDAAVCPECGRPRAYGR